MTPEKLTFGSLVCLKRHTLFCMSAKLVIRMDQYWPKSLYVCMCMYIYTTTDFGLASYKSTVYNVNRSKRSRIHQCVPIIILNRVWVVYASSLELLVRVLNHIERRQVLIVCNPAASCNQVDQLASHCVWLHNNLNIISYHYYSIIMTCYSQIWQISGFWMHCHIYSNI